MQYRVALLLAALTGVYGAPYAMPQGVTEDIAPSGSPPSGCTPSYSGSFGIAVMNITASPTVEASQTVE